MMAAPRADVLAAPTCDVTRFAVYTRASTAPDLARAVGELAGTRAVIEEAILAHAEEGCALAGATYDDVTSEEAPDTMPAFERLVGHVTAGRIHHVFLLATERARGPLPQMVHQITRLRDAGAFVFAMALLGDASLAVLEPVRRQGAAQ
jgi:hypothetical protein